MTKKVAMTLRLLPDTMKHVDEMAAALGVSRNRFIELKLEQEYDAFSGSPKLKDMLATFNQISDLISGLGSNSKSGFSGLPDLTESAKTRVRKKSK